MAVPASTNNTWALACLILLLSFVQPAAAFGAGSTPAGAAIKGFVWRHGDIAELLLQMPVAFDSDNYAFTDLEKMQVYFGNWLRDYSQLLDVASLKHVSSDWLQVIVSVLGFMEFGFATDGFEVTYDRLWCYRAEQHIDNPKGYGCDENGRYLGDGEMERLDPRLRLEVDPQELEIDPKTGMKRYIHDENSGFNSSAGYIREQLTDCINKYRAAGGDQSQRSEAMIHLGAAMHTLEDFLAHSNYIELALTVCNVDNVYHYTGQNAKIRRPDGKMIDPLVTGTFGKKDLYHSLIGELKDRLGGKQQQALDIRTNSIREKLRSTIASPPQDSPIFRATAEDAQKENVGNLFGTLGKTLGALSLVPGLEPIGGLVNNSMNAVKNHDHKNYVSDDLSSTDLPDAVGRAIEPLFKLHDGIMRWIKEHEEYLAFITEPVDKIKELVSDLVWSALSLIVGPIINLVYDTITKGENDFIPKDDASALTSTDPSHTDICKDHLDNMLNCPAGRVATLVSSFTVEHVVRAWGNDQLEVSAVVEKVIEVLHHPEIRKENAKSNIQERMLNEVQSWVNSTGSEGKLDLFRLSKESIDIDGNKGDPNDIAKRQSRTMYGSVLYTDYHSRKRPPPSLLPEWVQNLMHQAAQAIQSAAEWLRKTINDFSKAVDQLAQEVLFGALGLIKDVLPAGANLMVSLITGDFDAIIRSGMGGFLKIVGGPDPSRVGVEFGRPSTTLRNLKDSELELRRMAAMSGEQAASVEDNVILLYRNRRIIPDIEMKTAMVEALEAGERPSYDFLY